MDGFEMGDMALKWDSASGGAIANTSTRVSTNGGYYLHPQSSTVSMTKTLPTASAQVTVGAAIRLSTFDTSDYLILLSNASSYAPVMLCVSSSGYLQICDYTGIFSGTNVLATGTTRLVTNTWYYMEMQVTLNDTNGYVEVRLNGLSTPEVTFTGNDFYPGGSANIDTFSMQIHGDVDDVYVINSLGTSNNAFLGDVRVYALKPSGNGTYSQLTGSDGDSVNNYALVGEQPYNTANYVGSATSGQHDTYAMSDIPGTVTSVLGVQNNLIAAKSDAGTISMKPAMKIGASLYYGATRSPGTAYSGYQDIYDTNPATSTGWTVSDVNGLEDGMEVV